MRDSGNAAADTFATSLDCDIMLKSGLKPTTATSSPGNERLGQERRALDRRVADQLRVVRDDGEVVQRMDVLDAARNLERARERKRTSPIATGTVLRSTTTQPRSASAMSPVP